MRKINVMLPCCFSAIAPCIMLQQHVVFFVFQLRAVEPAAANPAVRSWQPQGPQQENGFLLLYGYIYHAAFQQKRIRKALFLCGKNGLGLGKREWKKRGFFTLSCCGRFILGKKFKKGHFKNHFVMASFNLIRCDNVVIS